mgnify:CR=1 FL=1
MKTEICHQIFFENQIEKAAYSDKHTEKKCKTQNHTTTTNTHAQKKIPQNFSYLMDSFTTL